MSEYITHEQYTYSIRQQVVAAARAMLTHELSFLIGARKLAALRHEAAVRDDDADFIIFVAIASETDDFPLGDVCQHWDKHALEQLQPEIQSAEDWAYKHGALACNSLIKRFSK
ncbi:hypothetical protein [Collimonas sp. OK242]|jgi:hypothetical protein|uniref:hypothetical protein n=1 Tax=Collimonas sp. OK242 TaxID=1798195 RepID=UPI000B83BD41|nr:hypothetical protein [Collimonas sp. OK242]